MHRSRRAGFIIDCQNADLASASRFWSKALGTANEPSTGSDVRLDTKNRDLVVEVQRVDHESRLHLDLETDDLEAEVGRLERLGARRVAQVKTWWVPQAPTGQRFCVVRAASPKFAEWASVWD